MPNGDCKGNTSLYAMEQDYARDMNRRFFNAVEMLEFGDAPSILAYYDQQITALASRSEILSCTNPIDIILDSYDRLENALYVLSLILEAHDVRDH